VFPPIREVFGPGVGALPLTPQNRIFMFDDPNPVDKIYINNMTYYQQHPADIKTADKRKMKRPRSSKKPAGIDNA